MIVEIWLYKNIYYSFIYNFKINLNVLWYVYNTEFYITGNTVIESYIC